MSLPAKVQSDLLDIMPSLLRAGLSERQALTRMRVKPEDYYYFIATNSDFRNALESARKDRANFWFDKVIDEVDDIPEKDEVPAAKMKFDKLKYLAEMDNPQKYAPNQKVRQDTALSIHDFRDMTLEKAKEILNTKDPFAIEVVKEDSSTSPDLEDEGVSLL